MVGAFVDTRATKGILVQHVHGFRGCKRLCKGLVCFGDHKPRTTKFVANMSYSGPQGGVGFTCAGNAM